MSIADGGPGMVSDLSRLLKPQSLAVIGGGAWCEAVITQARAFGFDGDIWPIHPSRSAIAGIPAYRGVPALPAPPDAAFIGINRDATIGVVERLRRAGAGGAVCFASGFAEAHAEDDQSVAAQSRLLRAGGQMPILGPNCYGFMNALDGVAVWPDQHGLRPVTRGVAILTQSSNIAINLTFQKRALPIAMVITCGNMAQLSQAAIASALLDDPRITAIGFHIEGFTDLPGWDALAQKAADRDIPLIALKSGQSAAARAATQSHTAALSGDDAGAQALLDHLGIGRVRTLSAFLEALKLGHICGKLAHARVASISCSGGEAALAADLGEAHGVTFPPLSSDQQAKLRAVLGPKVALANPLDYHTYIWRDTTAMSKAWSAMVTPETALTMTIVDFPDPDRADPADWDCAIDAAIAAKTHTGGAFALVSSLPDTLPLTYAHRLLDEGIAPLYGLAAAFEAIAALADRRPLAGLVTAPIYPVLRTLSEADAKAALAACGVTTPRRAALSDADTLTFPVAAKRMGLAHKSENNAVVLNLKDADAVRAAVAKWPADSDVLIEEMITDGAAELLVAFVNDPAHGVVLTIGAGGTLTELWQDTQHLMLPASEDDIAAALDRLRNAPLLHGFRGQPGAAMAEIVSTISQLQQCVMDHLDGFVELEINPLICTPERAVVADALWVQSRPKEQP